jgi:chromosome segregation ATPase
MKRGGEKRGVGKREGKKGKKEEKRAKVGVRKEEEKEKIVERKGERAGGKEEVRGAEAVGEGKIKKKGLLKKISEKLRRKKSEGEIVEGEAGGVEDEEETEKKEGGGRKEVEMHEMRVEVPLSVLADVEKLKAMVEALNEARNAINEKFAGISENIGELRAMILETENRIRGMEAEAERVIDVVRSVKPEKLMEEIAKVNAQADALRAKIESQDEVIRKIIDEIKDLRNKLSVFRNLEEIMKLAREMNQQVGNYKKLQAQIEANADRVQSIFVEVNKKFTDFLNYKEMFLSLQEEFKELVKKVERLEVQVGLLVTDEKFEAFKKEISNAVKQIEKAYEGLRRELKKDVANGIEDVKKNLVKKVDKSIVDFSKRLQEFSKQHAEMLREFGELQGHVEKSMGESKRLVEEKVGKEMQKLREGLMKEVDEKVEEVASQKFESLDKLKGEVSGLRKEFEKARQSAFAFGEKLGARVDEIEERIKGIAASAGVGVGVGGGSVGSEQLEIISKIYEEKIVELRNLMIGFAQRVADRLENFKQWIENFNARLERLERMILR